MNSNDQLTKPIQTEITSTAFRLPTRLLQMIDRWCGANVTTRSQFFRKSIMDRVKSLGIGCGGESKLDELKSSEVNFTTEVPKEEPRQWSPELYARLQRRR